MAIVSDDTQGSAPITATIIRDILPIQLATKNSPIRLGVPVISLNNKSEKNSPTRLGVPIITSLNKGGEMSPHLNSFDIDLSSTVKTLTLRFSKPVDPTSLDVTKVTIQDTATAVLSRALSDSTCSAVTLSSTITIDLGTNDYAYLTGTAGLADSQAHTWLTLAASAILDGSDISNDVIADGSGIQVTSYTGP